MVKKEEKLISGFDDCFGEKVFLQLGSRVSLNLGLLALGKRYSSSKRILTNWALVQSGMVGEGLCAVAVIYRCRLSNFVSRRKFSLFVFSFRDSISDYPSELKGSPEGFESVAAAYKNALEDEGRHAPHASGKRWTHNVAKLRLSPLSSIFDKYDGPNISRF